MNPIRVGLAGAAMALVLAVPTVAGAQTYPLPTTTTTMPDTTTTVSDTSTTTHNAPEVEGVDVVPTTAVSGAVVLPRTQANPAVAAPQTAPTGTLPFTGSDVAGLAALGAGLVVVGIVLARRGRSEGSRP